jgi:hypothetical protein
MGMKRLDTDAIIRSVIQSYEKYGKEDSGIIQKAYLYAQKAHQKYFFVICLFISNNFISQV